MLDRAPHQPLGARGRNRLDAHAGVLANPLRGALHHLVIQKVDQLLHFRRAGFPFDPGVHVFGIFAEDHHVHALGILHGRRNAFEIAHRPHASVQIKNLPQRHVQRPYPAAHRSRQRPLDRHAEIANRIDRILRKPFLEFVECLFPGIHLQPGDLPLSAVSLLDSGVKYPPRRLPDVPPGAIALDERNYRPVRHPKHAVTVHNCLAIRRNRHTAVRTLHDFTFLPGQISSPKTHKSQQSNPLP